MQFIPVPGIRDQEKKKQQALRLAFATDKDAILLIHTDLLYNACMQWKEQDVQIMQRCDKAIQTFW